MQVQHIINLKVRQYETQIRMYQDTAVELNKKLAKAEGSSSDPRSFASENRFFWVSSSYIQFPACHLINVKPHVLNPRCIMLATDFVALKLNCTIA